MKRDLIAIFLLIILSVPAIKDLFRPGAYTSHDLTHHIVRTINMDQLLSQGQFPPRWSDALNYGYGYPLFLFNYPLPSIVAVGFHHLGFDYIWSVKLTFALSMTLSAVFAYILFTYLWRNRRAGFVSSLFFVYAPIRFLNVYVSATFGNAVAFMFVPLIFYALAKAGRGEATKLSNIAGGLSLAGLMLSHNIMALMFLPIIGLFFLLHANRYSLLTITLGLGLSAWFWLPATLEKSLLRYDTTLVGFYKTHFPSLKQLFRSPWGYGFSHPGTELDDMSFQIGLAHILVVFLSLILLTKTKHKLLPGFFLIIFFTSIFFMLSVSEPLWKTIPLLSYLQMPWRLLAVSIFAASALAGFVTRKFPSAAIFLGVLVITANRNHWHINQIFDPGENYYLNINNTTTMASEHLPKGADKFDNFPPATSKLAFDSNVTYAQNNAFSLTASITATQDSQLKFNQIYFPGWQYWLDGQNTIPTYSPSRPLPTFTIPAGTHTFAARFSRTPIRAGADIISLVSLLGLTLYVFTSTFNRPGHLQRRS